MNTIWYQKSPLRFLLYPFSILYRVVIFIRHLLYRFRIFKTHKISVPVVVVGNITVGGTGKTPFTIALINELKKNSLKPGIILRGYGGNSKTWPQSVAEKSDPALVGDEAVLLAMKTKVPVMVGPNRVESAEKLISEYACDVIVSDDGLQHYALGRDVEIAVVDASRGFGNGMCLPAGPLREPVSRLKTVDFILKNGKAEPGEFQMQFDIGEIVSIDDEAKKITPVDCQNKKVIAVAAIGNPDRFFDAVRSLGVTAKTKAFQDHHQFIKNDFSDFDADIILMTEKDAVKCRAFADSRFYKVLGAAQVDSRILELVIKNILRKT